MTAVVVSYRILDKLPGERGLLGVRAVIRRERGFHAYHRVRFVEIHFRHLFQAAGGTFLDTDQAALAVVRPDGVRAIFPGVAQHADIRAHDVTVVAAVTDSAGHAAVGLRDRLLAAVGESDLGDLAGGPLGGRAEGDGHPVRMPE